MNLKQLGILIVLVIVIGGAGLVLYKNQKSSWTGGGAEIGKKLLGNFPVNDVTHLAIRQDTNEVNLVKQDDQWRVRERGDYPANFSRISEFLLKAKDLKIVQTVQVGAAQLPRLQLAPAGQGSNSAVSVDFKGAGDKPIKTLLLGKQSMNKPSKPSPMGGDDEGFANGRYVKTGDSDVVAVISDPLENAVAKPDEWLNKDLFHIEKPKSITVDFPAATNSWTLDREGETNHWKLEAAKAGEKLDEDKISGVTSPFSSPSFTDVLPAGKFSSGTNPVALKIETQDGFDYSIKVGEKTNDDYFLTVSVDAQIPKERPAVANEKPDQKAAADKDFQNQRQKLEDKLKQEQTYQKWVYLVPSWNVDPVLKTRAELLVEKKTESASDASTNSVDKADESTPPAPGIKP